MNKYLIFRTDRIGDFLLSAILLACFSKCLVSLITHTYILNDSPHPHLSVSLGFLKTKDEENSSFL